MENKDYKDIIAALSPDQSYLICSRGGRVLHCSELLTKSIGFNASGRNLNDIIKDDEAADILVNTAEDGVYRFECTVGGKPFIGGARTSQGGNLVLVLNPDSVRESGEGPDGGLMKYISRKINQDVANISVSFSSVEREKIDPKIMGLITKSVFDLSRLSKNITTRLELDDGTLDAEYKRGDMAADIRETCMDAAEFSRRMVNITYADDGSRLDCLYDSTMIARTVLNLMIVCIGEEPPAGLALAIRARRDGDSYVVNFASSGGRAGMGHSDLFGHQDGEAEMEMASALIKKHGGNIMSAMNGRGGRIIRMTLPIVEKSERESFSSTIVDWYGGYDMVEVELAAVLPSEAYAKA